MDQYKEALAADPKVWTPQWDKIFTDRGAKAPDNKLAALAVQLSGWATTATQAPPKHFGAGMVKLSAVTGASTPDECIELAEQLKST